MRKGEFYFSSQVLPSISFYGTRALQNPAGLTEPSWVNRTLRFMLQVLVPNDMPDRERLFSSFILLPNMGAVEMRMRMGHETTVNLSSRTEPGA